MLLLLAFESVRKYKIQKGPRSENVFPWLVDTQKIGFWSGTHAVQSALHTPVMTGAGRYAQAAERYLSRTGVFVLGSDNCTKRDQVCNTEQRRQEKILCARLGMLAFGTCQVSLLYFPSHMYSSKAKRKGP